ncbi:major facilitator superfamily domain-containing protein [Podospora aff. communis PSN243]|uniref:Major facilitator superfamily domain-containing protein n=1 Tax=Podospora aff. communis PSN243 TaxID=3040156 RepID=A0AAV9GWZ5_9PEZI|nr:major facilitator superfamily domain-containing protein [Podospora aff. communis PSN243]
MAEHATVESDETRPLVTRPTTPSNSNHTNGNRSHWRLVLAIAALDLILNATTQLTVVPSLTILQDIVCRQHYAHVQLDPSVHFEDRCKVEPVQSEIAYINAWRDSLEILPALFLAVPYGALADRIGRKFVFLLAVFGCLMSDVWIRVVYWFSDVFPTRIVWLSGVWTMIGGGGATLTSIGYVLIADACPPEDRTTAFSYVSAGLIISRLVLIPVGGTFKDPWVPMFISSALMVAGFFLATVFVPETRTTRDESPPSDSEEDDTPKLTLRDHLHNLASSTLNLTTWLTSNARIIPLLLTFFLFQFGEAPNNTLLLQYASKRLGWTLAESSYLLSLSAATHLTTLSLLIPALSSFLLRYLRLEEIAKDQRLAQVSAFFLVTGTAVVALTSSPWLFTAAMVLASLGLAFAVPARSVVTTMVKKEHMALLYTGISVLTYGGVLAGGPVSAALFKVGMRVGGGWEGLPFVVATGCFVGCLGGVLVTWREKDHVGGDDLE